MCLSVNLNLWQVIVGTLVVLRDHRLSEEVVSQAVEVHFKRFHVIAEAVCEDTFLKWTSKMGHAIVLMAMKFKRLFTVSSTSKSAKLSQMKKALAERLAARSGSSDSLDMDKSLPDPLPLLEEVKPAESLEVLGQMLAESAKRAKAAASEGELLRLPLRRVQTKRRRPCRNLLCLRRLGLHGSMQPLS